MLTTKNLSAKANLICLGQARKMIKGELMAEAQSSEINWDPIILCNIFQQLMVIWRKYGGFEVTVDRHGKVIGFVDHDKYDEAFALPLPEKEAKALIARQALVPPDALFVDLKTHEPAPGVGTYLATYDLGKSKTDHRYLEVEINAVKRTIIAVRPLIDRR